MCEDVLLKCYLLFISCMNRWWVISKQAEDTKGQRTPSQFFEMRGYTVSLKGCIYSSFFRFCW